MEKKHFSEKVLVIGFGLSGNGSARLLMNKGYSIVGYDDNPSLNLDSDIVYEDRRGFSTEEILSGVELVVIAPSISKNHKIVQKAVESNIEVISEIELGYRYCNNDIIAVTGTNGKTTTALLIQEILKKSGIISYALGNIGKAITDKISEIEDKAVIVLETSSYQLERIKEFKPDIAICLNITPDHMERHGSMRNYALCKKEIFKNQNKEDYAILNFDDELVREFKSDIKAQVYFFSEGVSVKGAYALFDEVYFNGPSGIRRICSVEDIKLKGKHNLQNVLAAIVATKLLGVEDKDIVDVLKNFTTPKYRMEYIGSVRNMKIYNDSKATNIDATIKACKSLKGDITLIVGGYDKQISYQSFFCQIPKNVKYIIGVGENVFEIKKEMPEDRWYTYEIYSNLEKAIKNAIGKRTENLLFSPTTSSFDRYSSYIERGDAFNKEIELYIDFNKI